VTEDPDETVLGLDLADGWAITRTVKIQGRTVDGNIIVVVFERSPTILDPHIISTRKLDLDKREWVDTKPPVEVGPDLLDRIIEAYVPEASFSTG
jgi:hypothetical protein